MIGAHPDIQATAEGDLPRALLAVSEAIISHRDSTALFQELAGRLHQVVQFDGLALVLHDAASNTLRLHMLETYEELSSLRSSFLCVVPSPPAIREELPPPAKIRFDGIDPAKLDYAPGVNAKDR